MDHWMPGPFEPVSFLTVVAALVKDSVTERQLVAQRLNHPNHLGDPDRAIADAVADMRRQGLDDDAIGLTLLGHPCQQTRVSPPRPVRRIADTPWIDTQPPATPIQIQTQASTAPKVAGPPPWPTEEPDSLATCDHRLDQARIRIDDHGWHPKYDDATLARRAATSEMPVSDRFIVNFRNGSLDPKKCIGFTDSDGRSRYWATTFDQIEDADKDPYLIAAKLGIPESDLDPDKGFTLTIIDTHAAAGGGTTIVPTYENITALALAELDPNGTDAATLQHVMTDAYAEQYAELNAEFEAFCNTDARLSVYDTDSLKIFASTAGLSDDQAALFAQRRMIQNNLGANAEFTGDGTTKQLTPSNPPARTRVTNSRGAVETLTVQRNPPTASMLQANQAIKVLPL